MGNGPTDAVRKSAKAPSGETTTVCPFTLTVEPGSVVPCTTTLCASTIAPGCGSNTVTFGGVRSRVIVYEEVATTSCSVSNVTLIAFAPSLSSSA